MDITLVSFLTVAVRKNLGPVPMVVGKLFFYEGGPGAQDHFSGPLCAL